MQHLILVAVTVLGLSGLASTLAAGDLVRDNRDTAPVRSLLEVRRDRVVIQEFDLSCGAAALATLLTYQHGDPISEREVARGLIRREEYLASPELVRVRQGFSLLDLKRYTDGRGYKGIGYGQLKFEDLIKLAPIMTPVKLNGFNHFVIFRGVVANRVLLADPSYGNRMMSIERFENSWLEYSEFGKVGFVVARRDGAEPPNRLVPRLDDLLTPPGSILREALWSSTRP